MTGAHRPDLGELGDRETDESEMKLNKPISDMTSDELRCEVARELGWIYERQRDGTLIAPCPTDGHWRPVPEWATSLDAVARDLEKDAPLLYWQHLAANLTGKWRSPVDDSDFGINAVRTIASATARQRCEAWLMYRREGK